MELISGLSQEFLVRDLVRLPNKIVVELFGSHFAGGVFIYGQPVIKNATKRHLAISASMEGIIPGLLSPIPSFW